MATFTKHPTKMGWQIVTNTSTVSGITHRMELPISPSQIRRYESGMRIEQAFHNLTPEEREFIASGLTPSEWDEMFNDNSAA